MTSTIQRLLSFITITGVLFHNANVVSGISLTGPVGGSVSINEDKTKTNWDIFTPTMTGENGAFFYQTTITPQDGKLRAHYTNGTLYHLGEPKFDHETTPLYTVVTKVEDIDSSATITYTVQIADINELPEVTNLPTTITLEETPYVLVPPDTEYGGNEKIFTLHGYDQEEGEATTTAGLTKLNYVIASVTPTSGTSKFSLSTDPDSHEVCVVENPKFDHESVDYYNISIKAVDKGSPALSGPEKILRVDIIDLNERPFFNSTVGLVGTVNYDEELAVGTELTIVVPVTGELRAYDYDAGDVLTYQLDGPDQSFFEVRNIGGVCRMFIAQIPDYDQLVPKNSIRMNVRAHDKAGLITDPPFVLTMTINNINDNLPVCSPSNYTGSVNENSKAGETILTITCSDEDGDLDRYEIEDFTQPDTYFEVVASSGDFIVKSPPDLEKDTVLTFPVYAVQGIPNPQTSTSVLVTITIEAFNDNRPKWLKEFYNFDVRYDAAVAASVGKVTAVDNDVTKSVLTYDWVAVIYQFKLDPLDGRIRVQAELEDDQKWTGFAVAKDNDSPPDFSDHVPVRIDAFEPNEVLVDFTVSQPISYFTDERIDKFLAAISAACSPCLGRLSSMSSTPGEEDSKTTLTVYALTDSTTETFANIETTKLYVTKETMLEIFSSDLSAGTPSSATTTTGFHSFPVTDVRATLDALTAGEWLTQTGGGIAILCMLCLLVVGAVAAAIFAMIKLGVCKKTEPVSHNIKRPEQLDDGELFDYRYKNNADNDTSGYQRFSNVSGR